MKNANPVVIAYDISDNKVRNKARNILKNWRLDGQKSVCECRLNMHQAEELFLQVGKLLDKEKDRLLMAWLESHRRVLSRGLGKIRIRETLRHVK